MDKTEVINRLRGPVVPIITPFMENLELDLETLRENVQFLLDKGMKNGYGVMLTGGAGGEFPMLTTQERKDIARTVKEVVGNRTAVVVCAQSTNPSEIMELTKFAEEIKADAVQVSPTYYYRPSDDDVLRLFQKLDEENSIGLMIYTTWWLGYKIPFNILDTLVRLNNVVSIKWSAPTVYEYQLGLRKYTDKVAVIDNGVSHVWRHLLGASGFITHVSSFWPDHELELWDKLEAKRYEEAIEMLKAFNWPWYDFRVKMSQRSGGEAGVVKAAMEMVRLSSGPPRSPTKSLTPAEREKLKEILNQGEAPLK